MMDAGTFLGVDIGKSGHYAVAVDAAGKVIYQTAVANDEVALRKLVVWAHEHQAVLVVDQPGGAAALLLRLCWQSEVRIGYLHGLAMARAREFYAGESKTDPKDAFVLADVARAHPSRIVWLEQTSDALAHLELLCGYDADLRGDANRLTNRLRALLGTHWPALERALGERLDTRGVLAVLQQYPSGPALKQAGVEQLTAALKAERIRRPDTFAKRLYEAAMAQTVTITGAQTAAQLVIELAASWRRSWLAARPWRRRSSTVFSPCPRQRSCGVCRGSALASGHALRLRSARSPASAHQAIWRPMRAWGRRPGNRARPSTPTCPAASGTTASRTRCSWPPSPA